MTYAVGMDTKKLWRCDACLAIMQGKLVDDVLVFPEHKRGTNGRVRCRNSGAKITIWHRVPGRGLAAPEPRVSGRGHLDEVRKWAKQRGIAVSDAGRVRREVLAAYAEEMGRKK